jgi:hypothetical protein
MNEFATTILNKPVEPARRPQLTLPEITSNACEVSLKHVEVLRYEYSKRMLYKNNTGHNNTFFVIIRRISVF